MVETQDATEVKELIQLHLDAAKLALNRGDKENLVKQLMLALGAAENEM